jgi:hypothetical protein
MLTSVRTAARCTYACSQGKPSTPRKGSSGSAAALPPISESPQRKGTAARTLAANSRSPITPLPVLPPAASPAPNFGSVAGLPLMPAAPPGAAGISAAAAAAAAIAAGVVANAAMNGALTGVGALPMPFLQPPVQPPMDSNGMNNAMNANVNAKK